MKKLCVIYSKEATISKKPNMYYNGNYNKWVDDIEDARFISVAGAQRLLSKWQTDQKRHNFNINNYDIIEIEVKQVNVIKPKDNSKKKEEAKIKSELAEAKRQKENLQSQINELSHQLDSLNMKIDIMNDTDNDGKFTCNTCGKKFSTNVILTTNPPQVACPYCHKTMHIGPGIFDNVWN